MNALHTACVYVRDFTIYVRAQSIVKQRRVANRGPWKSPVALRAKHCRLRGKAWKSLEVGSGVEPL